MWTLGNLRNLAKLALVAAVMMVAGTVDAASTCVDPPKPPAKPAANKPVPVPASKPANKPVFAPYFESYKATDLAKVPSQAVTLAFLLGNSKKELSWDGTMPLDEWQARAKASGKTIVLSFGGAAGAELAHAQRDPAKLAKAYAGAAKMYASKRLDFDIEGAGVGDAKTVAIRNKALALLPGLVPGVKLQYTLPVMPFGLDAACLALLRDAKAAGVALDAVNLMVMDYGGSFTGDMGAYAIDAAMAVRKQLKDLGMGGVGVGLTPMIGQNDVAGEVFTLEDARQLAKFASSTSWVKFVGFWAVGRDNGRRSWLGDSSMISQKEYEFTKIFAQAL
jgi:chitinase